MKNVFQLCWVTSLRQLTPLLVLVMALVAPFLFPQFTNIHVDPDVETPARLQAAWQVAWCLSVFWLLFYAANTGSHLVLSRMGEYWKSSGVSASSQLVGVWLSAMLYALLLACIPMLICVFSVSGRHMGHWWVLSLQHVSLMLLVLSGLVFLAVALASRFGATIGYVGALLLALSGLLMVPVLKKLVLASDIFFIDILYTSLPHFGLADLTHRFIHQQGAMSSQEYFVVFEYLAGWSLLLSGVSCLIFTTKEK